MKTFTISFLGKPIGSVHAAYPERVTLTVQAENRKAAQLKAYDTHEHVTGGADWVLVTEEKP